jgi:hypothetical protein
MSDAINRTVLAPSTIRLVGRVLSGIIQPAQAAQGQPPPPEGSIPPGSAPNGLPPQYAGQSPLARAIDGAGFILAHILAYSFAGNYLPLHVPAYFLVLTQGEPLLIGRELQPDPVRLGLAHLDGTVRFARDLRYWTYDRTDYIIRLDSSSGTLQQMVLDVEINGPHGRRIDLVGQDGSFTARLGGGGGR